MSLSKADVIALVQNGSKYILMMLFLSSTCLTEVLRWRYYLHEYGMFDDHNRSPHS